jgi:hypothetical protein
LNQSVALTAGTIQTILQSYLGNIFNMFIVKCDVRSDVHLNSIDVSAVFYKYIQRARLVKSRRMALLIAAGIFKTKPPLYYVRLAQGFVVPDLIVTQLETLLQDSFGVHLRLHLHNLSQVSETQYRKLDRRALFSIDKFMQYQQERLEQTDGERA